MKKIFRALYGLLLIASLLALGFLCLYHLDYMPLQNWDEARHGVSAYEMVRTGEPVVTTYGYAPDYWNLKPPVSEYFIMLGYKILGFNLRGLRLYSALAMILTGLVTAIFAERHIGTSVSRKYSRESGRRPQNQSEMSGSGTQESSDISETKAHTSSGTSETEEPAASGKIIGSGLGFVPVLALAAMPSILFAHGARNGDADMLYVLFYTLTILCLILSHEKPKYLCGAGFFMALAFLTKSWHAAILGLVIVCDLVLHYRGWLGIRRKKLKERGKSLIAAIICAAAPVLIWALARISRDGMKFLFAMIGTDVVGRAQDGAEGHGEAIYYYVVHLLQDRGIVACLILAAFAIYLAGRRNDGEHTAMTAIVGRGPVTAGSDNCKEQPIGHDIIRESASIQSVPEREPVIAESDSERETLITLLLGAAMPLIMFTLATTKLTWYLFPAYPMLALLAAMGFASLVRPHRTADESMSYPGQEHMSVVTSSQSPETAQTDTATLGPVRTEPAGTTPAGTEPTRTESARTAPAGAGLARTLLVLLIPLTILIISVSENIRDVREFDKNTLAVDVAAFTLLTRDAPSAGHNIYIDVVKDTEETWEQRDFLAVELAGDMVPREGGQEAFREDPEGYLLCNMYTFDPAAGPQEQIVAKTPDGLYYLVSHRSR